MIWALNLALFAEKPTAPAGGAASASGDGGFDPLGLVLIIAAGVAALVFLIILFVFFSFVQLWIQSLLTGANISIWSMFGMKLRKVPYSMIVNQKIALVQAGVPINTEDLEAHFLAGGRVLQTVKAVIAAHKAGLDLSWKTAAAIDLAGRDVLDAVRTSVNPKVIDCPDPAKGKQYLDAVCRNGIQLLAKARVTVRTKLERLVGGATEETIIARVGEGIVKAIGSAHDHREVLANPGMISQTVLHSGLDAQTAFFRPHNRSEDVSNLYLVGQGTQPGGGTPSVMMSAKMTVREIAKDFAVADAVVNGVPGVALGVAA